MGCQNGEEGAEGTNSSANTLGGADDATGRGAISGATEAWRMVVSRTVLDVNDYSRTKVWIGGDGRNVNDGGAVRSNYGVCKGIF